MWVVPSHGRPKGLLRLAESFEGDDLQQPVAVMLSRVDDTLPEYFAEVWPDTWTFHVLNANQSYCGDKMNAALALYPHAKFYGHLCDDIWLKSKGQLQELVDAAGDWNVAYPSDPLYSGKDLICFPVMGGKLVQAVGWWAHPQLKHNCIDSVITDIADEFKCRQFLDHIHYDMHTIEARRANWDETYQRVELINLEAGGIYHRVWDRQPEQRKTYERIRQAMEGVNG